MLEIKQVLSKEQIKTLSKLAKMIWEDHFIPLIGSKQVDYMLTKFLSEKAINHAINIDSYQFYEIINKEVIGFFSIKIEEDRLFLSKLYLIKDVRGNGYAKIVMNTIENLCKEAGLNKIWLTCNKYNETTLLIYKKMGFEIFDEAVNEIGNGYQMDDYYLMKTI